MSEGTSVVAVPVLVIWGGPLGVRPAYVHAVCLLKGVCNGLIVNNSVWKGSRNRRSNATNAVADSGNDGLGIDGLRREPECGVGERGITLPR